jgi:transcriptional regulator with XRE-family HTH domain
LEIGITQEQLASAAGINRSYVGDIERGARNVALSNLKKLADALELELHELIRRVEEQ